MNLEKWEATRAKGKKRFLWVNGFVFWGFTTAILWSIVMQLTQPAQPVWIRPLIALVLFPIGGLVWAHFVWRSTEAKYNKARSDTNS